MPCPQIVGRSQRSGITWRPLAPHASAAQPERRLHVGPDDEAGRRLASRAASPSSLARSALRRQTPKVRAGCSNRACPDLCGGCPATGIPTAIQDPMRTYRSGVGMGSYLRNDRTIAMYNQSSFGRRLGLAVLARVTDDPPPSFELACCALECSSPTYLKG